MAEYKERKLKDNIRKAAGVLGRGGVVAAATETFFGLLADIENPGAVDRIRKLKDLDESAPLLVIAPSMKYIEKYCFPFSSQARRLAEIYWPGPLTMILKAKKIFPSYLAGPFDTVAMRIPGKSDAADILAFFGKPLTATSCNPHGQTPAFTGRQVMEMFGKKKIDFIVPGTSPGGLPSTIVDATVTPPVIRRRGIVGVEGKYLRG